MLFHPCVFGCSSVLDRFHQPESGCTLPREGWDDEKGACAVSSCSSYHQWRADSNNRLFLGFQCRKSGAFSLSWVWLCVPTASQSQGFSWLYLLLNSNAWGYSCQGYGGHVGMWQYPTCVSQIKWLIHKENLSHSRSHAEAECWLDCKHPFNGWTHCRRGHLKWNFFLVCGHKSSGRMKWSLAFLV